MKISILSSLAMIVITAVIASMQGQQLRQAEQTKTTLEERVLSLGLALDATRMSKSSGVHEEPVVAGSPAGGSPALAKPHAEMQAEASAFSRELIEFAIRMRAWQDSGSGPPPESRKELFAFLGRFLDLDPEALPLVIDDIRSTTELEESEKNNILGFSLMLLSQSAPETALTFYLNAKDITNEGQMQQVAVNALKSWASQDPAAALAWLDSHRDEFSDQAAQAARQVAITHSFSGDPKLAVSMALQLERDALVSVVENLHQVVKDPREQLAMLRRVSKDLGDLPDSLTELNPSNASKEELLQGGILSGIGQSLARRSFENFAGFLDGADLTRTELGAVTHGVAEAAAQLGDHGKWLAWIDQNATDEGGQATAQIVRAWTTNDFQATAAWIGEQPNGDLKNRATHSFSATIASHEPDTAANWALTLPPSGERQALLQDIHISWRNKDPEAAAEFALQHGLPEPEE